MDVILFLLKALTKLSVALAGALVAVVTFGLVKFGGAVAKKAQQPVPQQAPQPVARAVVPEASPAAHSVAPAIHVHVHVPPAAPQPAPHSMPPAYIDSNQRPVTVLDRPDHRIYITSGSHLMMEHPFGDKMLEHLDYMLYAAAHRDGDPFPLGQAPDPSNNGVTVHLEPPAHAPTDDSEFVDEEGRPLPPPDGALWLRKAGSTPQRLTAGTPL